MIEHEMNVELSAHLAENGSYLGSYLSNNLKTNQLVLNTGPHTAGRPVAQLREPRDLFALPKDKDNAECTQQAARWPIECQVLDERIQHIEYVPPQPEPYYRSTGTELQPRPVGDENGVVVYAYNPISAVNYSKSDSDVQGKQPKSTRSRRYDSSDEDDEYEDPNDDSSDSSSERGGKASSPSENEVSCVTPGRVPLHRRNLTMSMSYLTNRKSPASSSSCSAQFSRSSVGGSKFLMGVHPSVGTVTPAAELIFESRFESANLAKAVKITPTYYELYLRSDLYTSRSSQWFYFRVMNTRRGCSYRLSIVNLVKSGSLYNEGMRPLMYSTTDAQTSKIGWRRCGENISYFKNEEAPASCDNEDEDSDYYTLTFNIEFPHDHDVVYFAHSYPYTYSDLQDYLMAIQRDPIKSKFCKLRLLCRSLAGNNVYFLTVTASNTDDDAVKKKRAIVVSARVHPGETPASWMMKGLLDFITGDSYVAKKLRHRFIFKIIPMLNPDGVIVGNTRCSLAGKDLNRQYRTVIRETYPSIWYTKTMIKRLTEECGVLMYCDMHAHSRKHNVFIYGCENKKLPEKRLTEQVFPLMLHKNTADKFCFESCNFKVQRNKEGTGRIVIWMLGISNSYTMEASFGGSSLGGRKSTHFSTADYEHMGRAFCETLMDYSDDNQTKEMLRQKILVRLSQEGSNADEPLNVALTDYSSDEGESSSCSTENEVPGKGPAEGPCCAPPSVPPSSPTFIRSPVVEKKITAPKKSSKSRATRPAPNASRHKKSSTTAKGRSTIELHTTAPDFDGLADDCYSDLDDNFTASTLPKHYTQLRAVASATSASLMPPELIIRPAQRGSDLSGDEDDLTRRMPDEPVGNRAFVAELPPLIRSSTKKADAEWAATCNAKRGHSWQGFRRCVVPVLRVSNMNEESNWDTPENLFYRLSPSKKIWEGVVHESMAEAPNMRSLSWRGYRPASRPKPTTIGRPTSAVRNSDTDLLQACTQKLLAWQSDTSVRSNRTCLKTKKMAKLHVDIDSSDECSSEQRHNERSVGVQSEPPALATKIKPKKKSSSSNTLNKVATTGRFLSSLKTRVTAVKTNTLADPRPTPPTAAPALNASTLPKRRNTTRFKTGGIVVTATTTGTSRAPANHRRTRGGGGPNHLIPPTQPTSGPNARATSPATRLPFIHFSDSERDSSKIKRFVRRVKNQMKRRNTTLAADKDAS